MSIAKLCLITWDHPRLRGEHNQPSQCLAEELGSPPPARGALQLAVYLRAVIRITPACAGSIITT